MPELTPFGGGEEEIDYKKLIKEFGTQDISTLKKIPDLLVFRKNMVISHRDFDKFLEAQERGEKTAIITGFNASGSMHLGHKFTFDMVLNLQKKYKLVTYVPITDDESYVCKKIETQEQGLKNAKLIAAQLFALGFDKKLTKIFIHSQYTKIYNLAIKLSTKYTLSAIKAIYGFDDSTNPGLMFYPVLQAADILLPQELEGKIYTVTPIGIDQDPHLRLVRDLAPKYDYLKPTTFHVKYLHGLKGGKMSKSKHDSAITLDMDPKKAAKLVLNAFTGGQETIQEQKEKGGVPEKCVVLEYLNAFFENEKEITERINKCKSGKIMCGECKKILAERIESFLADFQKKVEKEKKDLDKYLMR